jgi:hypothetical protein
MEETYEYQHDVLGLQSLNIRGRIQRITLPCTHDTMIALECLQYWAGYNETRLLEYLETSTAQPENVDDTFISFDHLVGNNKSPMEDLSHPPTIVPNPVTVPSYIRWMETLPVHVPSEHSPWTRSSLSRANNNRNETNYLIALEALGRRQRNKISFRKD